MEDIKEILAGALNEEDEKGDQPGLKIMTNMKGAIGEDREGSVVKYYKVTKGEDYEMSVRPRHYGRTYMKRIYEVKPRKFYNRAQVDFFVKHLKKLAHRDISDIEMMMILKCITRGEMYELVCFMDITDEVKNEVMYEE